jgi:hypothetical protein
METDRFEIPSDPFRRRPDWPGFSGFPLTCKRASDETRSAREHRFAVYMKNLSNKWSNLYPLGTEPFRSMQYEIEYHFVPAQNACMRELSIWTDYPILDRHHPDFGKHNLFVCQVARLPFEKIWLHFVPHGLDEDEGSRWRAKKVWWRKTIDWERKG